MVELDDEDDEEDGDPDTEPVNIGDLVYVVLYCVESKTADNGAAPRASIRRSSWFVPRSKKRRSTPRCPGGVRVGGRVGDGGGDREVQRVDLGRVRDG